MKVSILVLAVLLGSATSGVTTYLLLGTSSESTRAAKTPVIASPDAEEADLAARMEELTRENAELSMRLATLEGRPVPEQRAPLEGYATRSELEALRDELAALRSAPAVAGVEQADFKDQVQGALIDIRKQEQFDKVRGQQEKRLARLDEDVQKVGEWLQLSSYQQDELRTLLSAQYAREDDVRRRWEAGEDPEALGQQKEADRELFRAGTSNVFTEEQYETFWNRFGRDGEKN